MNSPPRLEILVVDDDLDFLELLLIELQSIPQTHVDVAHDFVQAVQLLQSNKYALVLSDWALDSRTASEAFVQADQSAARSAVERTPVMFMSGSDKVGNTRQLKDLKHFEPVSFILKRMGPPLICWLAENILHRFYASDERVGFR